MTFGPREARLTEWMAENAAVAWIEMAEPWQLEDHILTTTPLPLNIDKNNRLHSAPSYEDSGRQLANVAGLRKFSHPSDGSSLWSNLVNLTLPGIPLTGPLSALYLGKQARATR